MTKILASVAALCAFILSIKAYGLGLLGYQSQGYPTTTGTQISNGYAHIPLCFPNGFPYPDAPANQCYNQGFQGSLDYRNGPCLPPVVNGKLVPPCQGQYYALTTYYY